MNGWIKFQTLPFRSEKAKSTINCLSLTKIQQFETICCLCEISYDHFGAIDSWHLFVGLGLEILSKHLYFPLNVKTSFLIMKGMRGVGELKIKTNIFNPYFFISHFLGLVRDGAGPNSNSNLWLDYTNSRIRGSESFLIALSKSSILPSQSVI